MCISHLARVSTLCRILRKHGAFDSFLEMQSPSAQSSIIHVMRVRLVRETYGSATVQKLIAMQRGPRSFGLCIFEQTTSTILSVTIPMSVTTLSLPYADDFHTHLRQGALMRAVTPLLNGSGVATAYVMVRDIRTYTVSVGSWGLKDCDPAQPKTASDYHRASPCLQG